LPQDADPLQLALDGPDHAPESDGDLLVRVPLDLPKCDVPQLGVIQPTKQPPVFVGHFGGQLRSRLPAEQLSWAVQGVGFGGPLPALQVDGFADRNDSEQTPQVGAIIQLNESTLLGPQAKAFEGAQCHVLVVPGQCGDALEPGARQADQPPEVNLQQPLHG